MNQTPEERRERDRLYKRQYRQANADLVKEQRRRYSDANRDEINEQARQYRQANPEKFREYERRRYESDSDRLKEENRQYRQANPEKRREYERRRYQIPERQDWMRRYREANRDRINEASRRRYKANPEGVLAQNARWRHGKDITEDFAAMWQVQGGCCYLCKKPLTRGKAVVDHDHAHCGAEKSCSYCRRGLACTLCNVLIGDANDDPQLLRTIADNLESALNATRDRIAAAPRQEMLDLMEA